MTKTKIEDYDLHYLRFNVKRQFKVTNLLMGHLYHRNEVLIKVEIVILNRPHRQ